MKKIIALLIVSVLAFASMAVEAKRMGGGKSMGQQSSNVSKRATPPTQAALPATAAVPTAARPWGAMLGGLAAGLGLAWLASSLGLGAAFGNILMALLIGAAVLAAIGWFMRKRMAGNNNLAYQGASGTADPVAAQPTRFTGSSQIGSAISNTGTWTIPVGFDVAAFESAAKQNFVMLQSAWDIADINTLSTMMTDHMLQEMQLQLSERDAAEQHRTAVVSIESKLLGIEETADQYVASVEFTGVIQETVGEPAEPFTEVWNMTKNKTSGGWLLAGIQTV